MYLFTNMFVTFPQLIQNKYAKTFYKPKIKKNKVTTENEGYNESY